MSATDTVKAFIVALEARDFNKAASYLSDDFVFSGVTPQPVGKNEFLGMQESVQTAFPDWSFNLGDLHEDGDTVKMTLQISGTQTGQLDLSPVGLPPVPPTGKKVSLPKDPAEVTVKGGKITAFHNMPSANGGLPGMLSQLGVQLPHP